MSVSIDHELMVLDLIQWLDSSEKPIAAGELLAECSMYRKVGYPPSLCGYRPDVLVSSPKEQCYLVAEAKTSADLETERTKKQISGFIDWLAERERGFIVIGVPWDSTASAKSLLRNILRKKGVAHITAIVRNCSAALLARDQYAK